MSEPVTVRILDREYTVGVGEEERDSLAAAARMLDARMRELRGGNKMVEDMTRQNMKMFEDAMAMFTPFGAAKGESKSAKPAPQTDEVADLKEEMEAMRRQLAELSQRK